MESIINAYRKVLTEWVFPEPTSFSEAFAIERFQKKFQVPDVNVQERLADEAWQTYLRTDETLPQLRNTLLQPEWYKARWDLHQALSGWRFGELGFPKGTEFIPTHGHNSIEARLCQSRWTCTHENFEAFSKLCYDHRALRHATKRRYAAWYKRNNFDAPRSWADKQLWKWLGGDVFRIFQWKLERIVTFQYGSRFSTVAKNNKQRRPINIECFANILVQKAIGNSFRSRIKSHYGIDLDTLQDHHRLRISDKAVATIDLRNASDSISLELVEFLLPGRVFREIEKARSAFVLGPDDVFHTLKKVSSMGNGFTFELMSMILTAICRTLDPTATVFGDDIIIEKRFAGRLIQLLESVGLQVNIEKSFTEGPFRESCGGNFHDEEGYIKSFDFEWPENIHDCVMIQNKCFYLRTYPSFKKLYDVLSRGLPKALHGGLVPDVDAISLIGIGDTTKNQEASANFPSFFITRRPGGQRMKEGLLAQALRDLGHDPTRFRLTIGFRWSNDLRSQTRRDLSSRAWAKYLMYLHAGMVSKDELTNRGIWKKVTMVTDGRHTFRVSNLVNRLKADRKIIDKSS